MIVLLIYYLKSIIQNYILLPKGLLPIIRAHWSVFIYIAQMDSIFGCGLPQSSRTIFINEPWTFYCDKNGLGVVSASIHFRVKYSRFKIDYKHYFYFTLTSDRYCKEISWFHLDFMARKSAYFSSISWLENQLISARFLGWKISWFQLVLFARKSTDFSLFSWLENQLISACILD